VRPGGEVTLITNIPAGEWAVSGLTCDAGVDDPFLDVAVVATVSQMIDPACRLRVAGLDVVSAALWERVRDALGDVRMVDVDAEVELSRFGGHGVCGF